MNKKLEVEILKVVNAGHFHARPVARPGSEYESLLGKINDYFQCGKGVYSHAVVPKKGKIYVIKRTLDKCWYRARIQNIMTTMCGPQASVHLVDVGETTLVPYSVIRELPAEYEGIPYQTMNCHLIGVKPLSMVSSYFDLTTSKQVTDRWSEAANDFFISSIRGCKCTVLIQHEDAKGNYHVLLYAESSHNEICVNDHLVQEEFAVLSNELPNQDESPSKAERRRVQQENFQRKQQEIVNAFRQDANLQHPEEISSTDDEGSAFRSARFPHTDYRDSLAILRHEVEELNERRGTTTHREEPNASWPANQEDFLDRLGNSRGVRGAELFDSEIIDPLSASHSQMSSVDQSQGTVVTRIATQNAQRPSAVTSPPAVPSVNRDPGHTDNANRPLAASTLPSTFSRLKEAVYSSKRDEGPPVQEPMATISFAAHRNAGLSSQQRDVSGMYKAFGRESETRSHASDTPSQKQFSLSSDEDSGRVRFTSARLPATAKRDPSDSSSRFTMPAPKPILKKDRTPPRRYSGSSSDTDRRVNVAESPFSVSTTPGISNISRQSSSQPYISSPGGTHNVSELPSNLQTDLNLTRTTANAQRLCLPSEIATGRPQAKTKRMVYQDGIVIHGEGAPIPFNSIENSPFFEYGPRLGISVPTTIQKHCWPALLRGRDVVGVAPTSGGKSLAYLLPIVEQVVETGVYQELPRTNGPLVLILCANWQSTAYVYEECQRLTRSRRRTRVEVIFSSGAEQERSIPLINGCEILVATPPCFLRMLKHCYTTLDRLCHVVFDDADILVEDFTSEVKEIMRVYGGLLKAQPARLAPRQTVVMTTRWTVGVASLVRAYLGNPLIILADMIEASIFAGVKQPVTLCSSNQRFNELLGFLDNLKTTHDIVIFTYTTEEAKNLGEFLKTHNHFALIAHEFLQPHELAEVKRQWNTPHVDESIPILVMTDSVMSGNSLSITNASLVIHYDFPNKSKYGKRLRSMASTFTSIEDHGCISLIFLTERSLREAKSAHQLLTRSRAHELSQEQIPNQPSFPISPLLEEATKVAQQTKEEAKKHMDLCYFLMAYGYCRKFQTRKCVMRHIVLHEVDFPSNVPTSGTVKILILHVMCATRLWVRILEHRDPGGDLIPSSAHDSSQFLRLTMDMGLWYSSEANQVKVEIPRVSDLCALEHAGSYHRVKVCDVVRRAQHSGLPLEVEIQFVDHGIYECVKVEKLLQLPQEFCNLPFQAVQVFVCRVQPRDKDITWTHKANYFVRSMVEGKELDGKVVFSLNNTLWLDPLLERRVLKSINVTTNVNNIRLELIKQGLATDNKSHIRSLRSLCENAIDLSIYDDKTFTEGPSDPSSSLETMVLDEEDFTDVSVSAVENPGLFFVQLNKTKQSLVDLEEQINDRVASVEQDEEDIAIGSLCIARFTIDDKWYRARVLGMRGEAEYDVFYVDHGDREWVSLDRIRPPWPEVFQLSLQAVECSLANVSPLENDWAGVNSDAFFDMTDQKHLFAKVKSKVGSLVSGYNRFVIELIDTSTMHDIYVSQEMVALGHAQASPEGVQTWFPEAIRLDKDPNQSQEYEKIPEMCLEILKSRDQDQKLYLAKMLQTIVMNSVGAKDAIRESGGLNCICRLLLLTRAPAVQEHLLVSLDCLTFQNESNCEEARRNGALKTLCYLLEKSTNVTVQARVAWTLKNVSATERNRDTVRELGGIKVLCSVLETAKEDKLQEHVAWALEVLAFDNERNCKAVNACGGVKLLCQLVTSSSNKSVVERATRALAALAPDSGNRNAIRQFGGLEAICRKVQDNPDEEYLRVAVGCLKSLVNNNNHNRDVLRDLGMILTLQSLLLSPQKATSTITRRLCKDLLERLVGWAVSSMAMSPSPTKKSLPPSPGSIETSTPSFSTADTSPGGLARMISRGAIAEDRPIDDEMPPLEGDEDEDVWQRTDIPFPAYQPQRPPVVRRQTKTKQVILAKPIDKSDDSGMEDESETSVSSHPITLWSQEKYTVRVAVQLRGAKKSRVKKRFHEKAFHFSTKMQSTHYQLDLELFDSIIPEECQVQVKGAEIVLILKKSHGVKWNRLLKTKEHLACLRPDLQRLATSSSDEDSEPRRELPKRRVANSPKKPIRAIFPEMDTGSSASSESEEEYDDYQELISFD